MNTYTVQFPAVCPNNGIRVMYTLKISTGVVLPVEEIIAATDDVEGYHEEIADQMLARFGGSQTLTAFHHGVTIETIRPHIAVWSKPSESAN